MRAKPYVTGIALRRTQRIPFAKDAFLKTELTFDFFFPLLSFIYYSVYKFYFFYDILLIAFFLNVLLLLSCAVGSRTLCKRSFLFIAKAFSEPLAQPGVFIYNKNYTQLTFYGILRVYYFNPIYSAGAGAASVFSSVFSAGGSFVEASSISEVFSEV